MSSILQVAQWLLQSRHAVVFTGAGMSTESGIPDFRSPSGVWSRNTPVFYNDFLRSAEARHEYWRQKAEAASDFVNARPNAGHLAIAGWERDGRIVGVITQNIDGLHQDAGNQRVLELHGTARWIDCVDCGQRFEPLPLIDFFRTQQKVPPCADCGGRLKSATISFGQALPTEVLDESSALAEGSDLFIVIGSSLVVHPAAGLPEIARRTGARVVIINRDPTDQDSSAAAVIRDPIGATLTQIDAAMR